jgi:hypothetical protein
MGFLALTRRFRNTRQAETLQSGLRALLDRVEQVREEHDRLEGENRFLQEYDYLFNNSRANLAILTESQLGTLVPL